MANASSSPNQLRQELDRLCKSVMAIDAGRVLPLFFTPALLHRLHLPEAPLLLEQLDKEFSRRRLRADYLLRLRAAAAELANHWEFQKFPDPLMPTRIANYQAASFEIYGLPMLSFVVHLTASDTEPWRIVGAQVGPLSIAGWVIFSLPALVRTWPEQLTSPLGVVFRCLVSPVRQGLLVDCFQELTRLGLDRPTCWELVEMLAFLLDKMDGGDGSRYLELLREDLAMLQAEDSLFYRYGVEKATEKERQRTRDRALRMWQERFPGDEAGLARLAQRLGQVQDGDVLLDFLIQLQAIPSLDAALSLFPALNGHSNGNGHR